MAEIELRNVSKLYADGTHAVKDMSLEIADGEFMILVGPSGCGKTTALRMLAGLERISAGEVRVGGAVVNDLPPRERDVAMVFQNYALYPHMSVRHNMGFALKLAKVDKAEINRRVEEVATALDLVAQLDRKPAKLSGGQRQRVAMGRAIIRDPKAFLMDEPLSNLDAKLRVQMRTEIATLQARLTTTTVYVTHDQTEAMTLGDRVAVMNGGVLQQVATPRELYSRPANLFVASFIGSPAMNLWEARLDGGTLRTPIGEIAVGDRLRRTLEGNRPLDGRVVVGTRPEDIVALDASQNGRPGHVFEAPVVLTESVGPDLYAHFQVDVEEEGPSLVPGGKRGVARLEAKNSISRGERLRLWLDPDQLHVFDAEDGRSLTGGDGGQGGATASPSALARSH